MGKYYAVKKGKIPGIYNTWSDCQEQIKGFSGAKFHSFSTLEEAHNYMAEKDYEQKKYSINNEDNLNYPLAFVDGSYNPKTKVYGYGCHIEYYNDSNNLIIEEIKDNGNDENISSMRNITGELLGAIKAIETAIKLNLKEINIYYDYNGIELWANKQWSSKNPFVIDYIKFVEKSRNNIQINFYKVPAHTGIKGNECADLLAKQAVGV